MKNFLQRRDILYLYHFTNVENLENILVHGIMPRAFLESNNIEFCYNDRVRMDGRLDCSSFSVTHPNYKMLHTLRIKHPQTDWVVIEIKSNVLVYKTAYFYSTNAASNTEKHKQVEEHIGLRAFNAMFEELSDSPSRIDLNLSNNEPTDVQAEIMIQGIVEPIFFESILVNDDYKNNNHKIIYDISEKYTGFNFFFDHGKFYPRHDYKTL